MQSRTRARNRFCTAVILSTWRALLAVAGVDEFERAEAG